MLLFDELKLREEDTLKGQETGMVLLISLLNDLDIKSSIIAASVLTKPPISEIVFGIGQVCISLEIAEAAIKGLLWDRSPRPSKFKNPSPGICYAQQGIPPIRFKLNLPISL